MENPIYPTGHSPTPTEESTERRQQMTQTQQQQ